MLVKTYGSAVYGISAQLITVEVDVGQGAKTQIIGLPDNAVKESQPRINAAMKNSGFTYPRKGVVINMAPADIRKEGSAYDLTTAIGVMAAGELIHTDLLEETIIMGELSLDGGLQAIKGALPIAIEAKKKGLKVDRRKHLVLESGHPSPLSANRGYWFGNNHFNLCNDYLIKHQLTPIEWFKKI